jgi:tetratricopeptide (TPR) repeat protein
MSMAQVWLFRIVMLALVPLLLLAAEAGLRLVGYGHRTSFFLKTQIGGRPVFVENARFGMEFFPPNQARSPAPVVMDAVKPANTYRIFLLGESAALGDPDAAYGPGRYLETLLNARFPAAHFEVVCVAMTAINSHAIRSIARECATHQGDLWIIYMGNNEMVGPFGAGTTVFGLHSPPLGLIRLDLALQRTRLGQLFMAAVRGLNGGKANEPAAWEGMKTFADSTVTPNDSRKEGVYNSFRANLEDILRAGRDSGAKIILNTVAVNLKDCAPFGSLSATNLPEPDRLAFGQTCRSAISAENEGHFADATRLYGEAETVCPKSAELEFLQARCLLRLTNNPAAREHFGLARDYDTLPFRTDSRINALITEIGRQYSSPGLVFCDAARLIATNSPSGIPGAESFYEHVHFNFDGNYRLALGWAEVAARLLPAALRNQTGPAWASQESCERDLGVTDWNRYFVFEKALARVLAPPFTDQLDHSARLNQMTNQLLEIKSRLRPDAVAQARAIGRDALQRRPGDHWLLEKSAEVLEATGDLPDAEAEWEKARELLPHHFAAYYQVGRLLADQGKLTEAEPPLLRATAMRPDSGDCWLELGEVHAAQNKPDLALQEYERAGRLLPRNHWVPYQTGRALVQLGRGAEAIADFQRAIALGPKSFWNGHYALGEELAFRGRTAEARSEFEEVVRLKPLYAPAHLNLGVALVNQKRLADAQAEFEEVIRLQPENKAAKNYLSQIQNAKRAP